MKDLLKFKTAGLAALLFVMLLIESCSYGVSQNFKSGEALGTTYNITYFTNKPLDLQNEIDSIFAAMNASMSTYIPNSDISRINRGDSTVVIDSMFREVMAISAEVFERSGGYFDPTVGVLVNAWGFGPGTSIEQMDSTKVDSLLQFVGFGKVSVGPDFLVYKEQPGIQLDFNAIAKGYTVDRLAAMIETKGIANYLVEVGGELVGRGQNALKEKPWVVGIDDPQVETGRALKKKVTLTNRALASSGNYRKFRVDSVSGRRYVHTIDPISGFTRNSNVLAASVVANSCVLADAYATAFMAMDLDESIKLLVEQKELEAYIIYLNEEGNTEEFMTTGFAEMVVD